MADAKAGRHSLAVTQDSHHNDDISDVSQMQKNFKEAFSGEDTFTLSQSKQSEGRIKQLED